MDVGEGASGRVRRFRLIGVPSSAGAHAPGLEGGPAHLRAAGIRERLSGGGLDVVDGGDLPIELFDPVRGESGSRNLQAVLRTIYRTAGAVADAHRRGEIPILLGGDCTIVLGGVLGLREAGYTAEEVGLFYLDGDADLDTPAEGWGILDSCGIAHLIGDGDPMLAGLAPSGPLLLPGGVVLFGFHPAQLSPGQWRRYAGHRLTGVPVTDIPEGRAEELATDVLGQLTDRRAMVLHLDVDVIDYASLPLADCPRYHGGLSLSDTMAAVTAAARRPTLACLTLTEVNPDHDRSGALARDLVAAWSRAIVAATV